MSGAPSGGAPSGGASGASVPLAGASGASAGSAAAGAAGAAEGGMAGASDTNDVTVVKPSTGCGKAAPQATGMFVKHTVQTSGSKPPNAADGKTGPWSYARDYYVWLPADYDERKAYPLVIELPGCGGDGTQVYSLSPSNSALGVGVEGTVIRVGLTPPPNDILHATNPGQGCFDDREGDDSVEWPFYEAVLDQLKGTLCYDEQRVFAVGNSSGAWLANELGCKYAGNTAGYAIRGVATNGGGLFTNPQFTPTCSTAPLAGAWLILPPVSDEAVQYERIAIARAMKVAQCSASSYDTARLAAFPIGAAKPDSTCQRILDCPADSPLVVCDLSKTGQGANNDVANPAFAALIRGLEAR